MKKSKEMGITLIALVITIILLLILAGIVISQMSNGGIFDKAKQATEKYTNQQKIEEEELKKFENYVDGIYVSARQDTPASTENTVSNGEHFTGEYWFNGKKIYARTYYISKFKSSGGEENYSHGITDADTIWVDNSKSFIIFNDGNHYTIPRTKPGGGNHDDGITVYVNLNNIVVSVGYDRSDCGGYVTVNYTKKGDTGNGTTIPDLANN